MLGNKRIGRVHDQQFLKNNLQVIIISINKMIDQSDYFA